MFDLILSACLKQVLLYIKICVSLPGLQLAIQKENLESCSISPDSSSSFGSTSSETELLTVKENVRFGGSCEDLAVIEKEASEFQNVENIEIGVNNARKLSGLSDLDQEIVPDLGHEISFGCFGENTNMIVKEAEVCQDVEDVAVDEDCVKEISGLSYLEQEVVQDLGHEISVGGACDNTGLLEKETTGLQNVDNTKVLDNHGEVSDSSHLEPANVHDLGNEITIENVSEIGKEDLKDNIESDGVSVDLFDVHLKSESPNDEIDDCTIEQAIVEPDDCTHAVNEADIALDSVQEKDDTVNGIDNTKCGTVDDDDIIIIQVDEGLKPGADISDILVEVSDRSIVDSYDDIVNDDHAKGGTVDDDKTIIVQVDEGLKPEADISDILVEVSNGNIVDTYNEVVGEIEVPVLPVDDCDGTDNVVDNQREDESERFNKSFAIELISTEDTSVLMSSIENDRSSHTEALGNQHVERLCEISDSSQDRSKSKQDNPISVSTETVSPVLTPEHEHATGFYEVNPVPLQDISLNMQSSGISETISPVETPEHEFATGFYEVSPESLQDTSLNMQSSGISETISLVETPEHKHATGFYEVNSEPLQDKSLNMQSSGISETISPVETPEHEHAAGFYEVNPDPLQDKSLNMQSSGISETISPVETQEHEHATGIYEVNPEPLPDNSLNMQSSGLSETISPVETPEHEHAKGFYEVNPESSQDKLLNMQSSGISETISPVETPEHEHAKGFYEVNPESSQEKTFNMQSSDMSLSPETISPVETPEHEQVGGFHEVNPVVSFTSSDMLDNELGDTTEGEVKEEDLNAQLQGTVLQNIAIGKISSPVDNPSEYNISENYKINPMIPDITIEEDVDVKSEVFDITDLGLTKDEKFIEMTTNLVQNVINGAIKYIVDMKQTSVVEKDTLSQYVVREEYLDPVSQVKTSVNRHEISMFEQDVIDNVSLEAVHTNHITDRSEIEPYPADSDSDESVESSTTTEGSYRIINSHDTSPLNTPDTSTVEDFVGAQKDTTVGVVQEHTEKTEIEGSEVKAVGESNDSECSEKKVVPQSEEERDILEILDAVNADTLASSVRSDSSEENGKASNCTDTGEVAEISASSSDSSDYVKKHKVEYTTRKQIFMTSAGRMSISIDSIADPLSDPDQPYMMTEHDTIHEETHAEVGYIIARAHSIIGHADETLARLSDATIARLKELADAAVSNSEDVDVVMLDDMDVVCDSSLLLSKVVTCLPSSVVNVLNF